jgi:hypothetical protein
MSSYRDEFLRLKMGSLDVLDVFCTVFECATTSRSKFKILSIFAIFCFLISGFGRFDHQNFDDFLFVGSKIFFRKYHHKTLSERKCYGSYALFRSLQPFWCFPPIFHISTCGRIFICGYIVEYSMGLEISHRKVWNLSFLTHFRTHS